ncbi:hypothetical protein [uncultured Psychromonas sp.]|jgi:hypothetical protein|nr:hypothetical protein [uncultured Psychromonas sp.]
MKNKKKTLRNKHVWFSVWNPKSSQLSPKCDAEYRPIRQSTR